MISSIILKSLETLNLSKTNTFL